MPRNPFLHLGCGVNLLEGFDNVDFYTMRFWRVQHIGHDLRYPLPYADKVFDGAFSEHTLEHLHVVDGLKMLCEVKRVLKPGSVFRVSVPDVRKYVDFYEGKTSDPEFMKFQNGCEAIWSLTQNWGHLSCWDVPMLTQQLKAAGFSDVIACDFRSGSNSALLRDSEGRRWESLYLEARA
jgi:SAM-dependent methyltransferase